MSTPAIQITNVSYTYAGQRHPILSDFSLEIAAGERFGLFGPNGAGKTTLMHLLTGVLLSGSGNIRIAGASVQHAKPVFGFVPQDFSFYPELSPCENLAFFGAMYGLSKKELRERSDELLEIFGLNDVRNKQVVTFSGGMKRRVNLAIGLIHKPQILILDEPTVGVDIQSRHAIIDYLQHINQQGTTLLYTSHQLHEAESLCTQVALMDEGNIVALGTLPALLNNYGERGLEGLFLQLTGKSYRDL